MGLFISVETHCKSPTPLANTRHTPTWLHYVWTGWFYICLCSYPRATLCCFLLIVNVLLLSFNTHYKARDRLTRGGGGGHSCYILISGREGDCFGDLSLVRELNYVSKGYTNVIQRRLGLSRYASGRTVSNTSINKAREISQKISNKTGLWSNQY